VLTETYLDGFDGDLYGKTLKIEFVRYLRDIQRFEDIEKLKQQLQADIQSVREGKK
jgi:riboflavin kinase/FMN adenylyltransferase